MSTTTPMRGAPVRHAVNTVPALISLLALLALTTVHHLYGGLALDSPNRLLVPPLLLIPFAAAVIALERHRRTGSRIALRVYAVVAFALAGLLGILHSAYSHLYKDLLFLANGPAELYVLLNPDEHYPPDDLFFEITGVLELAASVAIVVTTIRLLRASRGDR